MLSISNSSIFASSKEEKVVGKYNITYKEGMGNNELPLLFKCGSSIDWLLDPQIRFGLNEIYLFIFAL